MGLPRGFEMPLFFHRQAVEKWKILWKTLLSESFPQGVEKCV